ncbi:hypothetical protein BDV3_004061 [Batrachochytrium dendrobatidis]|nr:hypothetical protein QVD99_004327 [Batrachochytrium dendrobatidis]
MFLGGLAAAVVGSVCIGSGQTLQKYALNRIAQQHLPTQTATMQKRHGNPIYAGTTGFERFSDRLWLIGISLSYFGELGNWAALSLASAAVVTPLGIVSVLTNVFLAQYFLEEHITNRQRRGYMFVLAGVFGILIVAPKGESSLGSSISEILSSCARPGMVNSFTFLFIAIVLLIYQIFVNQVHKITLYVAVCSLFGTLTITSAKILSLLMRLPPTKTFVSKANETMWLSNTSTMDFDTTLPHTPLLGSEKIPLVGLLEQKDFEKTLKSNSLVIATAYLALTLIIVMSIGGQEFFKQQALGRFPVSRFQPMLYAGFNGCVVLSSVLLFGETESGLQTFLFIVSFGICMSAIVMGISIVQKDDQLMDSAASAKKI